MKQRTGRKIINHGRKKRKEGRKDRGTEVEGEKKNRNRGRWDGRQEGRMEERKKEIEERRLAGRFRKINQ